MAHLPYFAIHTIQTLLGLVVFFLLLRGRELRTYWPLLAMAVWQAPAYFVLLYVRHLGHDHISPNHAYKLYFYTFWSCFAVSAICSLLLTYVLFTAAMRPLKGLASLGKIVFAWVALISLLTAASVAFAPAPPGLGAMILAFSQLERASALITLSLVAFVAMAIRPMGLSVRSRVFGASIGTLILAAANMAQATYMAGLKAQGHVNLYNPYALAQVSTSCIALATWIYYFARPEPQRRFILLPTTSPFHHWNRVAEMLGHEPGVVAIGGVDPDTFAKSEVEIFLRTSRKINEMEAKAAQETDALPS
ncbi:MAG: hypothetical protein ACRYF4_12105 [Janthinobacterium lividum]